MIVKGSIQLTALKSIIEKRKKNDGTEALCLVIPLELNHLKATDKGQVYLNFTSWTTKQGGEKISRPIINQDPGRDAREILRAEGKYPPTLGNLEFSEFGEASTAQATVTDIISAQDDLPF
mgnify:CR=1 FL=1